MSEASVEIGSTLVVRLNFLRRVKMKIKIISVLLFFGLVFVLIDNAKASEFSEGDRDPPYVCKEAKYPNHSKIKRGFKTTSFLKPIDSDDEYNENTLVVFVKSFNQKTDNTDTSELEEKAKEALVDGEKSAKNYFLEMLGNKNEVPCMELTVDVLSGWVTLDKTSEEFGFFDSSGFKYQEVLKATITAVDDQVDFRKYGRIIIFMSGEWGFAAGTIGQWSNIETDDGLVSLSACWIGENDVENQRTLRHEILHTEGLPHAGSVLKDNDDCSSTCSSFTKGSDDDWPLVQCATYERDDPLDAMGYRDCYTSTYHLWLLGHLKEEQISRVTETANVTLIPRSSSVSGIKMTLIEIKTADGKKVFYFIEYCKDLGNFDSIGEKTWIILRYASEEDINGNDTLIFRVEEKDGSSGYSIFNLKDERFCDSKNGVKIEFLGEYGEGENSYVELQVVLEESSTPTPNPSLAPSPTPTLIPIPSPTLIPTLPPIPTPSLNPTLPPVPTPEPTVTSEEMILSVTINGQDATNNDVVVAKKRWTKVEVKARNSRGTILSPDRIDCKITNGKGKIVFLSRFNTKGVFPFKPLKRGKYSLEIEVSKEGFQTVSFQASFKAR